jgi:YHS domain-containing protein
MVCDRQVDEPQARRRGLYSEYREVVYSFCCPDCKQRFDAGPDLYLRDKLAGSYGHPATRPTRPDHCVGHDQATTRGVPMS